MDPLSVVASTTALVTLCYQVSTAIYNIVAEYKNVDSSIKDLLSEINGLSSVLESIGKLWTKDPLILAAQVTEDSSIWSTVQASLDDCRATITKLSMKIDGIQNGSFFGNSSFGNDFLKKTSAAIKLNFSMKNIVAFKQKISWHQAEMQGAFQIINLCVLLRSHASQEATNQGIRALQIQVDKMDSTIRKQTGNQLQNDHTVEDEVELPQNFASLVRIAQSLHSNASSIVGNIDRSTVWEGSTIGDLPPEERPSWTPPQQEQISRWILDQRVEENTFGFSTQFVGGDDPSAVTARPIFGAFPAASIVTQLMDAIQKLNDFIDSIVDTPVQLRRLREDLESLRLAVSASHESFQSQDAQSPLFRVLRVCLSSFRQLGITTDDWQRELDQGAMWRSWTRLVELHGQKRMVELGVQVESASTLLLMALQPAYQQTMIPDAAPPILDVLGHMNAHSC